VRSGVRARLAAVVVAVTLAAACSSDGGDGDSAAPGPDASEAPAGDPTPGGVLNYVTDVEPTCWDLQQQSTIASQTLLRNVLDSLVRLTPDGEFHGWLAETWEVSPDGLTYTFNLADGVTFHDGTPLDAAAVKFNLDRWIASGINLAPSVPYESATVTDPATVTVQLTEPYAPLLQILSMPIVSIVSPASVEQYTPEQLCAGGESIVGSGPFRSAEYVQGQSWTLERNEDYDWAPENADHTGAAHLDGVQVTFIQENSTRVGALSSGQAHLVSNVPPVDVANLQGGGETDVLTASAPGIPYSIQLNNATGPFADPVVREALRIGVDYDALVESLYQGLVPRAWSLLTPATANAYDASLEGEYAFDLEAAQALLDDAGWVAGDDGIRVRDGERLEAAWIVNQAWIREQRDVLGEGIQDAARDLGIDLQRETLDPGTFTARAQAGDYDLTDMSQSRAEGDMLNLAYRSTLTPSGGGVNYAQLNSPEVDQLLGDAGRSTDPAERADLYAQVQQLLSEGSVAIPVYVPTYLLGTRTDVHGVHFDAPGVPWSFYDVWIDQN
jgi:peptide/nickel transport system substrate-binding protein